MMDLTSAEGVVEMASGGGSVCACLLPETSEFEVLELSSIDSKVGLLKSSELDSLRLSEKNCRRVEIGSGEEEDVVTCIAARGREIAVGDERGRVRVWRKDEKDDPVVELENRERPVSAVALSNNLVAAVFGDNGMILLNSGITISTSLTGKCSCLEICEDGEGEARTLAALDAGAKLEVWEFDPHEELASDCKASLHICRDPETLSKIENRGARMKFSWNRSDASESRTLAVPGRKNLQILDSRHHDDMETRAKTGFCDDLEAPVLTCSWTMRDLVATASLDDKVVVWSSITLEPLAVFAVKDASHALLFDGALLIASSQDGRLAAARVDAKAAAAPPNDNDDEEDEHQVVVRRKKHAAGDGGDDDDDDVLDDEDDDDDAVAKDANANDNEHERDLDDDDDDVDDDGPLDLPDTTTPLDFAASAKTNLMEAQRAVMPGATGGSSPDESSTFLHWSSRGLITSRRLYEDEDQYVAEIEHYADDSVTARTERITTTEPYAVACLGPHGAFFGRNDVDRNSSLSYHPIGSWDANGAWSAELPAGEAVECVAAGEDWVAALTSRAFLRLYSTGGVCDAVVSLPGQTVSAVAKDRWLAIAFHCSATFGQYESQEIAVALYDVQARSLLTNSRAPRLPIPSKAKLKWLGFADDDASLLAMDDTDAAYVLVEDFGWSWTPVLDWASRPRANELDRPWPVSASGGALQCATLKGGASEPTPFPRPVLVNVEFDLPLASAAHDAGSRLAETQLAAPTAVARHRAALSYRLKVDQDQPPPDPVAMQRLPALDSAQKTEALIDSLQTAAADAVTARDKAILRQLIAALKAQRLQFALDLAMRLANDDSLDVALKIADAHGSSALADRLDSLIQAKDHKAATYSAGLEERQREVVAVVPQPADAANGRDQPHSSSRHRDVEDLPPPPIPDDDEFDDDDDEGFLVERSEPTSEKGGPAQLAKPTALSAVNNPFKLKDDHANKQSHNLDAIGELAFSPVRQIKKKRSAAILPINSLKKKQRGKA